MRVLYGVVFVFLRKHPLASAQNGQIVFLNTERVHWESPEGKTTKTYLENEIARSETARQELNDRISAYLERLEALPAGSSGQRLQIENEIDRIQREIRRIVDATDSATNEAMTKLANSNGEKLAPILEQLMREQGYIAMYRSDTAILINPDNDITDLVISRMHE